jgi:hypothetical protein
MLLVAPLLTIAPGGTAGAAASPQVDPLPGLDLPDGAVPGSTPDQREAWQSLTPEQQTDTLAQFQELVAPKIEQAAAEHAQQDQPAPLDASVVETVALNGFIAGGGSSIVPITAPDAQRGSNLVDAGLAAQIESTEQSPAVAAAASVATTDGVDADLDGLPESFEDQVAAGFQPLYIMSETERSNTGFARFADSPTQTITQVNTDENQWPEVHQRVVPLGFEEVPGVGRFSVVRLDYLTLWNKDDGIATLLTSNCLGSDLVDLLLGIFGLRPVLDQFSSHPLDNERTVILAAAPSGQEFNLDPTAYRAYVYYAAAHEETFLDHSQLFGVQGGDPYSTAPNYEGRRWFWETLAKHATYSFDLLYPYSVDGLPLLPDWIIASTYAAIDSLYFFGILNPFLYDLFIYIANTVFFGCAVERTVFPFANFPVFAVNVGEPGHPLPGYQFIEDQRINRKLTFPPFRTSLDPPPPRPPAHLAMDRNAYTVGQSPMYTVTGAPNTPIYWSSTFNGQPTGEDHAYYGQVTGPDGVWTGSGGPWEDAHIGSWVKQIQVGDETAELGFTVLPPTVQITVDSSSYVVGQSPLYTVTGPPNTPIYWSSLLNGVSTGEDHAYYGQVTGPDGVWSGYGGPWQAGDVGTWVKQVFIGSRTGLAGFDVAWS